MAQFSAKIVSKSPPNDDFAQSLDDYLDRVDKVRKNLELTEAEKRGYEEAFQADFAQVKREVILPALEKARDALWRKSYAAEVHPTNPARDVRYPEGFGSLSFSNAKTGEDQDPVVNSLSFQAYHGQVEIAAKIMMLGDVPKKNYREAVDLADITRENVESLVLCAIRATLRDQ